MTGGEKLVGSPAEAIPPLPAARRSGLWRGLLILTGISRVLMIPWYLFCALGSTLDLRSILTHRDRYQPRYVVDLVLLAGTMWWFWLFSVLLAWLFFTRRRAFPWLMGYFSLLLLLLVACVFVHSTHYPSPPSHKAVHPIIAVLAVGTLVFLLSGIVWPIYYFCASELRRVFTR